MRRLIFVILCASVGTLCDGASDQIEDVIRKNSTLGSTKILSRRKRYLIFPEGSSLQLVYCLTMPVIGKSTIFTIGGTAALAWELPHDPFQPYRKPAELLHRKDPPGKYTILDPIPNKKQSPQPSVNLVESLDQFETAPIRYVGYQNPISSSTPVRFPSINYSPAYNRYRYQNYQNRRHQEFHQKQQQFGFGSGWKPQPAPVHYRFVQPKLPIQAIPFGKGDRVTSVNNAGGARAGYHAMPEVSTSSSRGSIYHQVHRRTRRDLYGKIEKFLSAQSKNGKTCLLRAICEIHQKGSEKGTFMEEIMKAVFRVKPFAEHENEDDYDHAANKEHNCTELYKDCDSSILNFI